jgi:hypothetical protein
VLLAGPHGTRLAAASGEAAGALLEPADRSFAPLLDVFEPGPLSSGRPFLHVSLGAILVRLSPRLPVLRREHGAALICPLAVPDGIVGVLVVALGAAAPEPPLVGPLAALAAHTGGLLARDLEAAEQSVRREAALALAAALAERDPVAGDAARVVSGLARAVAGRLGLSTDAAEEAALVGLVQDVGALAVPARIVQKPVRLDPAERAIVEEHPAIGERILRAVPSLEPLAAAVRASHERTDGAGYPDGLAGDAIPAASRIVAACATWHAMTSARPHRGPLPREEALARLRAAAGAQLDPSAVGALEAVLAADEQHALRRAS